MKELDIGLGRTLIPLVILACLIHFCSANVQEALALQPAQVAVIANLNAAESQTLAKYYMEKRGIPDKNLLELRVPDKEWCSREEYERRIVPVVRDGLLKMGTPETIDCLVIMYGMPLKISPPAMTSGEKKEVEKLKEKQKAIGEKLKALNQDAVETRRTLETEYDSLREQIVVITKKECRSAFDSELALVMAGDYPLAGWVPNPHFIGLKTKEVGLPREKILLVSRLDGPNPEIVKKIIDHSIQAEKSGLSGKAYFDARLPRAREEEARKGTAGYAFYDTLIHRAAERVRKSGILPVITNEEQEVFKAGECPDAALYCGWYSHARYVDAFQWQPGAVGFHVASSECSTLRDTESQVWCKRMIEAGVAATPAIPAPHVNGLWLTGYNLSFRKHQQDC